MTTEPRTSEPWCQRCLLECRDGKCPRCGFDFKVSTLTPQDRAVIASLTKALRRSSK